jgi:hypothetical protein
MGKIKQGRIMMATEWHNTSEAEHTEFQDA